MDKITSLNYDFFIKGNNDRLVKPVPKVSESPTSKLKLDRNPHEKTFAQILNGEIQKQKRK